MQASAAGLLHAPPAQCKWLFQFLAPFATQTVVSELSRLLLPEGSEPIPVELVRAQQKCEMCAPPSAGTYQQQLLLSWFFPAWQTTSTAFAGPCALPVHVRRPTTGPHSLCTLGII